MIKLVQGFDIRQPLPIDGRILLSKGDMLEIDENIIPEKYFAICKDDGRLYLFDADNVRNGETGKFRLADQVVMDYTDQKVEEVKAETVDVQELEEKLALYSTVDEAGNIIDMKLDPETFILKVILKNANGEELSSAEEDFPLEQLVVDADYDEERNVIILHINHESSEYKDIEIPLGRLVDGLVSSDQFNEHVADDDIHLREGERDKWDLAAEEIGTAVQPDSLHEFIQPGENVDLTVDDNGVITINAVDTVYAAGKGINIIDGVISSTQASPTWVDIDSTSEIGPMDNEELANLLNEKQDVLTAGTGIAIENNVISNTQTSAEWGNIQGTLDSQTDLKNALDAKQEVIEDLDTIRAQAAEGGSAVQPGDLSAVATSGSYNDLADKPSIPAAQVNSDWSANSGVAQILNKPNLAAVATSGSYNDLTNKPSIPSGQVNSDWNASSGVAQILNKPTLATVATSGSYNDLSNKPSIPAAVSVKGDSETNYRTGQVNITKANIGLSNVTNDAQVKKSGDTMSGFLTLHAAPTNNMHAANKQYVDNAINALPEPMIFKGTVGTDGTIASLPAAAAANTGFTYKVITALSSPVTAKVGDTVISTGSAWTVIPSGDEPDGTVTSVTIKATSPIAIDSSAAITSSGSRTISHANSGATAGSYGDSNNQTPAYGGTFKVPYVTVNATGHVTGISEHTVKIPASDNSDTHRVINVNGTQALGNNTTALNLKNGSNVSITASGGDVTITATDTTYSAEKGISLTSGKFGHSNTAITAQGTQAVYPIKIDAYGHITGYGSAVTTMTPSSHAHGNIQNGGTLQTNDITIANGDKLVVTDASDSNKVARASISFNPSATDGKFLTNKGTFEQVPIIEGAGLYQNDETGAIGINVAFVTLTSSGWSTSSGTGLFGYKQTVSVSGVDANTVPVIDVNTSSCANASALDTLLGDWNKIYRAVASTGTVTFYAVTQPSGNIPVIVKG